MGEMVSASGDVAQKTVSDTVGAVVTALLTTSLGMGAVPIGAAAAGTTEQAIAYVRTVWAVRQARVRGFVETAADQAGRSVEELLYHAASDPDRAMLLDAAVRHAAQAAFTAKILTLARVYVTGTDSAMIDRARLMMEVVAELDVPHIELVRVTVEYGPFRTHQWPDPTPEHVARQRPELTPVLPVLLAKLDSLGIVRKRGAGANVHWELTDFGEQCAGFLAAAGGDADAGDRQLT